MFFIMTASAVRSSSVGLIHKISVPGSFFTGTWPPGTKLDPVEKRQTTVDLDEFIAALSERAVDPDKEEMTTVFQEAGFKGAGVDARFFGETHTFTAPHVFSSFIELESE